MTTLPKIRRVRQMIEQINSGCDLEVDGGIDAATAPLVVASGANVLVAGSAVFGEREGVAAAMRRLRAAIVRGELTLGEQIFFSEKGVTYANWNDRSWQNGRKHGSTAH